MAKLLFFSSLLLVVLAFFVGFQPVEATCPPGPFILHDFEIYFFPTGGIPFSLKPLITPNFTPNGPHYFYVVHRGANHPTGTVVFIPTSVQPGGIFKIRYNHGVQTIVPQGVPSLGPVVAGTDLIEFEVDMPPCAGTSVTAYSITLYQN